MESDALKRMAGKGDNIGTEVWIRREKYSKYLAKWFPPEGM